MKQKEWVAESTGKIPNILVDERKGGGRKGQGGTHRKEGCDRGTFRRRKDEEFCMEHTKFQVATRQVGIDTHKAGECIHEKPQNLKGTCL